MAISYTVIDESQEFNNPTDIYNRAANWALAGLREDRAYRLTAQDQKRILGFVVGKGQILCEWESRDVFNVVMCCFGTDLTYKNCFDLNTGVKKY